MGLAKVLNKAIETIHRKNNDVHTGTSFSQILKIKSVSNNIGTATNDIRKKLYLPPSYIN